jgi:hypothetical protein
MMWWPTSMLLDGDVYDDQLCCAADTTFESHYGILAYLGRRSCQGIEELCQVIPLCLRERRLLLRGVHLDKLYMSHWMSSWCTRRQMCATGDAGEHDAYLGLLGCPGAAP